MSYYSLELDKTRNLRYGMKALSLIEQKLNKPIMNMDFDSLSVTDIAVIIWAGLVHEDKELTVDRVMDLVDEHSTIPEVSMAVMKAFQSSFGTGELEGDEDNSKNE